MALTPDIFVAGALTLLVYTFLWKDNKLFKFSEYLFVGVSAAHYLIVGIDNIKRLAFLPVLGGKIVYVIPIILGAMIYFYFTKKYFFLYRFPIALLVGVGTGLVIREQAYGYVWAQSLATASLPWIGKDPLTTLNNIIIITGTIATISFFIFTRKREGVLRYSSTYGRYLIMAALGSSFGTSIIQRNSLLGSRIQALVLSDFKYVLPIALFLFAIWVIYENKRQHKQSERKEKTASTKQ